jgi:tetratricopeptide (TPR) repeat protein
VKAIVSLDGGAGSLSGAALVQESPYFETARLSAPMLLLFQPGGADLSFLESLRYSERTFARFPALRHEDFSGSGFFPAVTSAAGDPSGAREDVNRLMCRFLLAHLAGDRASMRLLDAMGASAEGSSYTLTRRTALPVPPAFEELKAMIRAGGIASAQTVVDRLKDRDPAPFSQETFRKLGSWLFDQGRNEDARSLFSMQLSMYPDSARSHFMLAIACQRLDDKGGARDHFARVLELIPKDFDLDTPTRKRYEATAKESIAALDASAPAP